MATGNETAMRALLDQVDRIRRRQRIAFGALFCALVAVLLWIAYLSGRTQTDIKELVAWSVVTTVVTIVYGVVALAIYISGQVRRVLKAIEITAKAADGPSFPK